LWEYDEDELTLSVSNEATKKNLISLPVQEATTDLPWERANKEMPGRGMHVSDADTALVETRSAPPPPFAPRSGSPDLPPAPPGLRYARRRSSWLPDGRQGSRGLVAGGGGEKGIEWG
jgi:hypothetical protein